MTREASDKAGGAKRNVRAVWHRLLSIALPMMLAEAADSILWITDTYFVSRLGDEAVASVGIGGYLSWLTFAISSIVFIGTMVVVAQAWGAGDKEKTEQTLGEALTLSLLIGSLVLVIAWTLTPLLVSLLAGPKVSAATKHLAAQYFRARLVSLPFSYMAVTVDSVFRATGRTRPIVVSSLAYTLTNIILDPILIFGLAGLPSLGVVGAGIASSIANIVFLVVSILLVPRIGVQARLARPGRIGLTIVSLGAPALIERLIVVGGHLVYLGIVARCGDPALAAHTIGVRIESLAFLPLFSIADATAALSGQAIGAGDQEGARETIYAGALLNALAGTGIGLVLVALSHPLPHVFTATPIVERLAGIYLVIASVSEPLFGASMSILMGIRGSGNTLVPLAINLSSYYTARVILGPWLARLAPPPYCAALVWTTMIYDYAVRTIIALLVVEHLFHKISRRVV